jgi:SAM-dependent methyltransferase
MKTTIKSSQAAVRTPLGMNRELERDLCTRNHITKPLLALVRFTKSLEAREGKQTFFDKLFPNAKIVRVKNRRHQSMDAIYNWEPGKGSGLRGAVENKMFTLRNCQALRNRYRLVVGTLESELIKRVEQKEIKMLSVAAGSARAVFDACYGHRDKIHLLTLFDNDPTAATAAEATASELGIPAKAVTGDAFQILEHTDSLKEQDIIEVIGLIDYLDDHSVRRLFTDLKKLLKKDGVIITSHIHPNEEIEFVRTVANWDASMQYRDAQAFALLLRSCGFRHAELIQEPHGIHTVAILEA